MTGGLWVELEKRPRVTPRRFGGVARDFMRTYPAAAAALVALTILGPSARFAAGVAPVSIERGATRSHVEWIDGPFSESYREYSPRPTPLGAGGGAALQDEAFDTQRRIDWLFEKRRLWASVQNALIHSDNNRAEIYLNWAEIYLQQQELRKDGDPKLAASIANARAVLALRSAQRYDARDCGPGATPSVQSACDARRHNLITALGFFGRTLAKDPAHAPSLFNRALVLHELGLDAGAAEAFEAVARLGEPGWAEEAARRASELQGQIKEWKDRESHRTAAQGRLTKALWQAEEGAGAGAQAVEAALKEVRALASSARDREPYLKDLYRTAAGATPFQRKLLAPLATDLGTPALAARLARPESAVSPAHAKQYRRWQELSAPEQQALAAEADRLREDELLLAIYSWTTTGGRELRASDAALHREEQLADDPYAATLARRLLGMWQQDAKEMDRAIETFKALAATCEPARTPGRCAEIERRFAYLYVTVERWSDAEVHSLWGMKWAEPGSSAWMAHLEMLSQITSTQSEDDPWLALAYGTELLKWAPPCSEYGARAAVRLATVDLWSLGDAEGAIQAMRQTISPPGCEPLPLSLPAMNVMAALLASKQAPPEWAGRLASALAKPDDPSAGTSDYVQYYGARAALGRNESEARAALEVIAAARDRQIPPGQVERNEGEIAAAKVRSYAYRELALDAAKGGDFERAFQMVSRQLRLPAPERCALAVTADLGRIAVEIRDARGAVSGDYSAGAKWRWLDGRGEALVPRELQKRLSDCPQVSVLASPGVFGLTRLLADLPWSYRVAQISAGKPGSAERRLVVANTDPPVALRLEAIAPWKGQRDASTHVLEHAGATLSQLKQELPDATDVELYMHGLQRSMDSEGPYLAMTPDPEARGEFRLTARFLLPLELARAPYVYLKACSAADAGFQNYSNRSLASAFIERGAQAVFAATVPIPDRDADRFFNDIRAQVRSGKSPAVALASVRAAHARAGDEQGWMADVVALEPSPVRP